MDERHGPGIFKWPDDRSYDGLWDTGVQHGRGAVVDSASRREVSDWVSGAPTVTPRDEAPQCDEPAPAPQGRAQ